MELVNEIVVDYKEYCRQKLLQKFGVDKTEYIDDPMYLYQLYKCRLIQQRPRQVLVASDLEVSDEFVEPFTQIVNDIRNGESLQKYQTRLLKKLDKKDDLLSHWKIQHLHLGSELEHDGYVKRTNELIFALFDNDIAYIIGLFYHGDWCEKDILEKLKNQWPSTMNKFVGDTSSESELSPEEFKILRSKGVNALVRLSDGEDYFPPGFGVSVSNNPVEAVTNIDKIIFKFNQDFETIKMNIEHIISQDPENRSSDVITIGLIMDDESKRFVFRVKETGFNFTIPECE